MLVDKYKTKTNMELVSEIETTKREIINNKYELIQNELAQKDYERKMMGDIANAVTEDGKPIYSNEAKRQLEFSLRTETDEDYNKLKDYLRELQRKRDEHYMELEVLEKIYEIKIEEMKLNRG